MNIYSKKIIRETYNEFVETITGGLGFNDSIKEIQIVFRPDIKQLLIYYIIEGNETPALADEVNNFGLTPFKELLSAVHKRRKETKGIVRIKVIMDVIKNG